MYSSTFGDAKSEISRIGDDGTTPVFVRFSAHSHLNLNPIGAEHSVIIVALKFLAEDLDSRLRWVRHLSKNNLKFCAWGVPHIIVGVVKTGA